MKTLEIFHFRHKALLFQKRFCQQRRSFALFSSRDETLLPAVGKLFSFRLKRLLLPN